MSEIDESKSIRNYVDELVLSDSARYSGPEKLVICVDSCLLGEVKSRLKNFLKLKCSLNEHEVALMVLTETDVKWCCDFQSNYERVIEVLGRESVTSWSRLFTQSKKQTFDISKVFKELEEHVPPLSLNNVKESLRVIVLYSRIEEVIVMEDTFPFDSFKTCPMFTVDVLFMPSFKNNCSEKEKILAKKKALDVFESLQALCNEYSYIFAVDNAANVNVCVTRLLAHPSVRAPMDKDWLK